MSDAADDLFDKVLGQEIDFYFCKKDHEGFSDKDLIDVLNSVVTYEYYLPDEFTGMMKSIIEQFKNVLILTEKQRNAVVTHICLHQEE